MTDTQTTTDTTTRQDDATLLDMGGDTAQSDTTANTDASKQDAAFGKPDWLSDDLWDAEKNGLKPDAALKKIQDAEKHEKMAKDLRDKLARRGLPPENPDDYKINIDDKPWKDAVQLPDEVMGKVKAAAHKLGISQAQFGPLAEAYLEAIATVTQGPQTEEDKAAAIAAEKDRQASEIAKLGANGQEVIRAVSGMVRELKAQGLINDEGVEAAKQLARTSGGVLFLNALRERMGGDHVPMVDIDPDTVGGVSHSAIQDMMNSPEYLRGDQSAIEKVEKMIDQTIKSGNPFKYRV